MEPPDCAGAGVTYSSVAVARRGVTRLDIADGFDVHDHRSKLKLLRQDGNSMQLQNRDDVGCAACGRVFERLFVTSDETVTFDNAPSGPVCVARTDEQILVFAH
jgi:hypothetical protein